MDPRVLSSWQVHPQDVQQPIAPASNYYYCAPDPVGYMTVPMVQALKETVAKNQGGSSFPQQFRATDYIQHLLASGQFLEWISYANASTFKAVFGQFQHEVFAFINVEHLALQGDRPYLEAYDNEVHDFEVKLKAIKAGGNRTTITADERQSNKTYQLANFVLLMMGSRSASLKQDCAIRQDLLNVESVLTSHLAETLQFQTRIKYFILNNVYHEGIAKNDFSKIMKGILPLHHRRLKKREELRQLRHLRALLEKRLGEAKARLEAAESALGEVKQEHMVKKEPVMQGVMQEVGIKTEAS